MALVDLLIVTVYMVGMVAIGFWRKRKATTQEQSLLAGRSGGPVLYLGTLT